MRLVSRALNGAGIILAGVVLAIGVGVAPAAAQSVNPLESIYFILDSVQSTFAMSLSTSVNRPVAPFTTGLVTDTPPGYCAPGVWKRLNGGTSTRDEGAGAVNADFIDFTVGADLSCFDLDGTDVSIGVLGGGMWGEGTAEGYTGTVDLSRSTYGVYGTATSGPVSAYLLGYVDSSTFSASDDADYVEGDFLTADRVGVSGSASYKIDMGNLVSLFPSVGFDITTAQLSPVDFDATLDAQHASLQIDNYTAKTFYVGLTLQKVFVLDDKSAAVPFVSGTIYDQLGNDITGSGNLDGFGPYTFTIPGEDEIFAEVGVGMGYVRVLDGEIGSAKQLTLAARADYKWNDDSSALNLTAQGRLQF
jgi:hypothetical protein